MYTRIEFIELFFGCHAGLGIERFCVDRFQIKEAADPDHEEFIKIACKDREKLQPFQKRH